MKVDGKEIQKHEISYVEVITLLKQLAREQETLNDFLNELARRTRSFDDFIEKIGIWIELKPGREKQYFDSIIKKSIEIKEKITWKRLGDRHLSSDNSNRVYVSKRIKDAANQAGFPMVILDLIKQIVEYKEFNFKENDPLSLIPFFDISNIPVPEDGRVERWKDQITEEEMVIISELDNIASQKKRFDDFLLELASRSESLDNIIDNLAIWFRLKNEKTHFVSLIYRAIERGGNVTWEELNVNGISLTASERSKLGEKINIKAKQSHIKFKMTLLIDVLNGFSKNRDRIQALLEKNNPMNILRYRYYKFCDLNQVEIREKNGNNCSENLLKVVLEITNVNLGLVEIVNIIDSEVSERAGRRTKNCRLADAIITTDQEREVVLKQIADTIKNNPETYKIKQPLLVIKVLRIIGLSESEAIEAVMGNLIEGNQLELARETNKNLFGDSQIDKYMIWERTIQDKEFSEFVLKGITGERTREEDEEYYNEIKSRMFANKKSFGKIGLRKFSNGKEITMNDIWEGKREEGR